MASKPANTDGRHRQLGCRSASRSKCVSQQQVHCGENEAFFTDGPHAGGLRGSRAQWLDGWQGLPALGHLVGVTVPFLSPYLTTCLKGRRGLLRHGVKTADQACGKLKGACLHGAQALGSGLMG